MNRTRWTSNIACSQHDLNPFGFCLCGHVKSAVYCAAASDMQDLQQRIDNGCGMVRTKPGIFQRVKKILCKCTTSRVEGQGGLLENFFIFRRP
jgi:hypothetical protein